MGKELFNWEDDPDLTTKTNVVQFPISEDEKARQRFMALTHGYRYSDKDLLTKEETYEVSPEKEEVFYYRLQDLKLDDKGRKYVMNDGVYIYIDDFGNTYSVCYDVSSGSEKEFIIDSKGTMLTFTDSTHTMAVTPSGAVYNYNALRKVFELDPNIILHPANHINRL